MAKITPVLQYLLVRMKERSSLVQMAVLFVLAASGVQATPEIVTAYASEIAGVLAVLGLLIPDGTVK